MALMTFLSYIWDFAKYAIAILILLFLFRLCNNKKDQESLSSPSTEEMVHFANAIHYFQESDRLATEGLEDDTTRQMYSKLVDLALYEADLVSDSILEVYHPQLPYHFGSEFVPAVKAGQYGLLNKNVDSVKKAKHLFDNWGDWLYQNADNFKR